MLEYEFMRNAFAASGIVAVVGACTGFFLVLRGQTFAGHALSHIGFTGATGAALVGVSPFAGLLAAPLAAGLLIGALGARIEGRDVAIGLVLALALGFGLLFLHFFTASAAEAQALLFGSVLGVDGPTLAALGALGVAALLGLGVIARPLLFATLHPEVAAARGARPRLMGVLFLAVLAVATAECAQIVGILLVFTLMVAPAAAAQHLTPRFGAGIAWAVALAVAQAWGGLVLAYETDWPASFWITAIGGLAYAACVAAGRVRVQPVSG